MKRRSNGDLAPCQTAYSYCLKALIPELQELGDADARTAGDSLHTIATDGRTKADILGGNGRIFRSDPPPIDV